MKSAAEGLFAVLFPSDCRLCGVPLENISRLPVCRPCLDAMTPLAIPVCRVCGERLEAQELAHAYGACGRCRMESPRFERALAYGSYEGGLRELILLLKYDGVRPAAAVLGRMLAEAMWRFEDLDGAVVVPVPLHRRKLRQRGFNQSELIAREMVKRLSLVSDSRQRTALAQTALHPPKPKEGLDGAPGVSSSKFRVSSGASGSPLKPEEGLSGPPRADVLVRTRETESQTGLTPPQRQANVHGAFAVTSPEAIRGRTVVLVDDVFTTGTTVSECARVLLRAGARRVLVATVARALKQEAPRVEGHGEAGAQLRKEKDRKEEEVEVHA